MVIITYRTTKHVEEDCTEQHDDYPELAELARESNELLNDILGVGANYICIVAGVVIVEKRNRVLER